MNKTKEEWAKIFSKAKHGHTLWDGNAKNPHDPELAHKTAYEFTNFAATFGFFKKGDRVLDLGCGNGRFGIPLSALDIQYIGIDPMREQILFSTEAFKDYPHLRFIHADIYNSVFNPKGTVQPEQYQFPFPNEFLDNTIAYSVFTHLQTLSAADAYMKEIKRTLKPGGKLFITWYRSPPDSKPTDYVGRTVYNEWDILTMLNGFKGLFTYGGHSGAFYDQWALFLQKL